nr:MAG TPA: hypothetical protein [Caudoviricetes sp.]
MWSSGPTTTASYLEKVRCLFMQYAEAGIKNMGLIH